MDYGHNNQSAPRWQQEQPFFTAGNGNLPIDQSYSAPEDDIDLTHQSTWERPDLLREIGGIVVDAPKSEEFEQNTAQEVEKPNNQSIVPAMATIHGANSARDERVQYNRHAIRTEGDHLSKQATEELNQAISRLSQTHDAATFYATIRGDDVIPGMVRDNIKNSFNREVS